MNQNQKVTKNTNWLMIIMILLVIALLGLAAIYFLFLKDKSNPGFSLSPSPFSNISPKTTPTISPSNISQAITTLKIFLIALDDNGKSGKLVGCGDSTVSITREVPETQTVLKASLEELLSIKDKNYGQSGLYNALSPSNLTVESAVISDGTATIKLNGELVLSGTCEDPRIVAQLEETAKQFSNVKDVIILINGKNIKDLIDLR